MFEAEIVTLFPAMVNGFLTESILGRAQQRGLVRIQVTDLRSFGEGKHRVVDDAPYGGGAGMVMKAGPWRAALQAARQRLPGARAILMSPRGERVTQAKVRSLAALTGGLILGCGRYEGVDERAVRAFDEELSLGDFVLTGGELAACAVVDAVARLHPEVLGNAESAHHETFEDSLLEHPHYTRPAELASQLAAAGSEGNGVPPALQSGDHARIARWRRWQALHLTRARRPDLLAQASLTAEDQALLALPDDSNL